MRKPIIIILAVIVVAAGIYFFVRPSANRTVPSTAKMVNENEKAQREIDKIAAKANLTSDQHDKVYAALVQFHTERDQVKKAYPDKSSPDLKAKVEILRDTLEAKVQAILTPEQYQMVKKGAKD